jgi:putative endonuclease
MIYVEDYGEHKNKINTGFSSKYNLNKLVYYEQFNSQIAAINREKQLKNWHHDWKLNLIKSVNPEFKDLGIELGFQPETYNT